MTTIFSKPKIVIPIAALLAAVVGFILYQHVGIAPAIPQVPLATTAQPIAAGSTVDLSFPKSGRIESVTVHDGEVVHRGDVLATLSAPDAKGAVSQAKGALDLARAQYASLDTQYATAKKQQDQLVENAYRTLLSSGLAGQPNKQDENSLIVTGTYTCGREGSYQLHPYASRDSDTGYSMQYSGLESGIVSVKYDSPVALGTCGLQVRFDTVARFDSSVDWTIAIPNKQSSSYIANKNAYDLAVATRDKTLNDISASLNGKSGNSVAQAQIAAAEGAYEAAVGAYQSNVITAPVDGKVTFIDSDAKTGHAVIANKTIISITAQ